jgi:hypothetical protein
MPSNLLVSCDHSRRGIQQRRQRRWIRRRRILTNNADTLSRIAQLPLLQITDDPFAIQLFIGSPFIFSQNRIF